MPDLVKKRVLILLIALLLISLTPVPSVSGQTTPGTAVVHAVLFYSSSCPHCHFVLNEVMPPLLDQHGSQLRMLYVNVQREKGEDAFWAVVDQYQIPQNRQGVPLLVIGDEVYVGGAEIPQNLPGRIEAGLQDGGIPWPDFPGMEHLLEEADLPATATHTARLSNPTRTPSGTAAVELISTSSPPARVRLTATGSSTATPSPPPVLSGSEQNDVEPSGSSFNNPTSVTGRIQQDLAANLIAIIVLIGMVASVISIIISMLFGEEKGSSWPRWVIPVLCGIGMAIAVYLSVIELTRTEAICGPVGDCHTVQASPYAMIGGLIPVGVLGVAGYIGIGITWILAERSSGRLRRWSVRMMWGLSLVGTLFSIYLTFLEPFVIGATCSWCLTSAVIMVMILWASTAEIEGVQPSSGHASRTETISQV